MDTKLEKSIDSLIDEMFAKAEAVPAELKVADDAKTTADAAIAKCPSCGQAVHPVKEIAKLDKEKGNYDADITSANPEVGPAEKVELPSILKKAEMEELEAFRAEKASKVEELRKAEVEATQEALIKSVVERTSAKYEAKIEALEKSFRESAALVKAVADAPQRPKSITSVSALEKSMGDEAERTTFSKKEMLDAAEELFMKGEIRDTEVIELENNGYILNKASREKVEQALLRK